MEGIVKWFDTRKGFGFITGDDGKDVFVHYSAIISDKKRKNLYENQKVSYSVVEGKNGLQADEVKGIEDDIEK